MSDEDLARALRVIPGGSSTRAKSPLRTGMPVFAGSAHGCVFTDTDGRSWVDWDMALGTVVWGHSRREIVEAIEAQCRSGILYTVPAQLEFQVAEQILERLDSFASLQFFKSGSESTSAAVRLARAATGRKDIVCGTYHGWHDWAAFHHYGGRASLGIPEGRYVRWAQRETFDAFCALISGAAAAIVCPEHWSVDDLKRLRAECTLRGTLLVFDEVKAGIRFSARGVFGAVGVTPDLICMSKGLANGMPLAIVAGSRELMQLCRDAAITGTHAGECLSLASAAACERLLRDSAWPPWDAAAREVMQRASDTIRDVGTPLTVEGYPGCFGLTGGTGLREHLASRGMFSLGWILPSAAHEPRHFAALADALDQFIRK